MAHHDTGTDQLVCSLRDRVATLTLNRPDVRNAVSNELTMALRPVPEWPWRLRRIGEWRRSVHF